MAAAACLASNYMKNWKKIGHRFEKIKPIVTV